MLSPTQATAFWQWKEECLLNICLRGEKYKHVEALSFGAVVPLHFFSLSVCLPTEDILLALLPILVVFVVAVK